MQSGIPGAPLDVKKEKKSDSLQEPLNDFAYHFINHQVKHFLSIQTSAILPELIPDAKSWSYQAILEQIDPLDHIVTQHIAKLKVQRGHELKLLNEKKEQFKILKKQADEIAKIIKFDDNLQQAEKNLQKLQKALIGSEAKQQKDPAQRKKLEEEIKKETARIGSLTKTREICSYTSVKNYQETAEQLDKRLLDINKQIQALQDQINKTKEEAAATETTAEEKSKTDKQLPPSPLEIKLTDLQATKKALENEKAMNLDPEILNAKQRYINNIVPAITKYTQEHLQFNTAISDLKYSLTKIPKEEKKQEMLDDIRQKFNRLFGNQPGKKQKIEALLKALKLQALTQDDIRKAHEEIDEIVASNNEIEFTERHFADNMRELENLIRENERNLNLPDDSDIIRSNHVLYPFAHLYEFFYLPLPASDEKNNEMRASLNKQILSNMKSTLQGRDIADGFKERSNQKKFDEIFLNLINKKIEDPNFKLKEQFEAVYNRFFKGLGVTHAAFLQAFMQCVERNSKKIKKPFIDIIVEVSQLTDFPENPQDPLYAYFKFLEHHSILLEQKEFTEKQIADLITYYQRIPPSNAKNHLLNQIISFVIAKPFSLVDVGPQEEKLFLREVAEQLIAKDKTMNKAYLTNLNNLVMNPADKANKRYLLFAKKLTELEEITSEQAFPNTHIRRSSSDDAKRDRELQKLKALYEIRMIFASGEYHRFIDINVAKYPKAFEKSSGRQFQDFVNSLLKEFEKEIKEGLNKHLRASQAEEKAVINQITIVKYAKKYGELCQNCDPDIDNLEERQALVNLILNYQFSIMEDGRSFVREIFLKELKAINPSINKDYKATELFKRDVDYCVYLAGGKKSNLKARSDQFDLYMDKITDKENKYRNDLKTSSGDARARQLEKLEVLKRIREIFSSGQFAELAGLNARIYTKAFTKKWKGLGGQNELAKFIEQLQKNFGIKPLLLGPDIISAAEFRIFSATQQRTHPKPHLPNHPRSKNSNSMK